MLGEGSRPNTAAGSDERPSKSGRILSVDVLRGICVAGMVLVNFPTDWVARYSQLGHADWNGATATDMIFPEFLFLSGFSMVYALAARARRGEGAYPLALHVLTRSLVLFGLGLLLNALPYTSLGDLHVFGVLQRIAFCYLTGGMIVLSVGSRDGDLRVNGWAVAAAMLLVLIGVWAAERFIEAPGYGSWRFDKEGSLAAVIDRAVVGNRHMSDWGGPQRLWDADGLLSCVTSIPNLLLGVLAASWLRQMPDAKHLIVRMLLIGAGLVIAALLLNGYYPINRKLWTGSFALLSGGVSMGAFAVFYYALDVRNTTAKTRAWLGPALAYGSNAILAFVIYSLLLVVHRITRLPGSHAPAYWLPATTYTALSASLRPENVSAIYGLAAVALVLAFLWPLYQRRIFLKL